MVLESSFDCSSPSFQINQKVLHIYLRSFWKLSPAYIHWHWAKCQCSLSLHLGFHILTSLVTVAVVKGKDGHASVIYTWHGLLIASFGVKDHFALSSRPFVILLPLVSQTHPLSLCSTKTLRSSFTEWLVSFQTCREFSQPWK